MYAAPMMPAFVAAASCDDEFDINVDETIFRGVSIGIECGPRHEDIINEALARVLLNRDARAFRITRRALAMEMASRPAASTFDGQSSSYRKNSRYRNRSGRADINGGVEAIARAELDY